MAAGSKRFVLLLLMLHCRGIPTANISFWMGQMFIGELARASGLSKDGIRYYEALGLLHSNPVQVGTRFYRDYSNDSIERLALIALGKRLYFPLSVMVEPLNRLMSNDLSREERIEFIKSGVERIDRKIEDLKSAKRELMRIIANPEKDYIEDKIRELGRQMD